MNKEKSRGNDEKVERVTSLPEGSRGGCRPKGKADKNGVRGNTRECGVGEMVMDVWMCGMRK